MAHDSSVEDASIIREAGSIRVRTRMTGRRRTMRTRTMFRFSNGSSKKCDMYHRAMFTGLYYVLELLDMIVFPSRTRIADALILKAASKPI